MTSVLWEADPFIEAAEDLQDSVDHLLQSFDCWHKAQPVMEENADDEGTPAAVGQGSLASGEGALDPEMDSLLSMCDSVRLQVGDFHKAVSAMTRNPQQFHVSEEELGRRFEFVKELSSVEKAVRHALLTGHWDSNEVPSCGEKALHKLLGAQREPHESSSARSDPPSESDRLLSLPERAASPTSKQPNLTSPNDEHVVFVGPRTIRTSKGGASSCLAALQQHRRCIAVTATIAGTILWSANSFSGS